MTAVQQGCCKKAVDFFLLQQGCCDRNAVEGGLLQMVYCKRQSECWLLQKCCEEAIAKTVCQHPSGIRAVSGARLAQAQY